jgi:hypothetical protein
LHPETKHGAASPNKDCNSQSFIAATSGATGKHAATVSRAAARGEALGDDLDSIAGMRREAQLRRGRWKHRAREMVFFWRAIFNPFLISPNWWRVAD